MGLIYPPSFLQVLSHMAKHPTEAKKLTVARERKLRADIRLIPSMLPRIWKVVVEMALSAEAAGAEADSQDLLGQGTHQDRRAMSEHGILVVNMGSDPRCHPRR